MKSINLFLLLTLALNLNAFDEFLGKNELTFKEQQKACLDYIIENILDTKTIRYVYSPKAFNISESKVIKRYLNIVASKCAVILSGKITAEGIEQSYYQAIALTPNSAEEAYYIITGLDLENLKDMTLLREIHKNVAEWYFPKYLAITDKLTIAANPSKL